MDFSSMMKGATMASGNTSNVSDNQTNMECDAEFAAHSNIISERRNYDRDYYHVRIELEAVKKGIFGYTGDYNLVTSGDHPMVQYSECKASKVKELNLIEELLYDEDSIVDDTHAVKIIKVPKSNPYITFIGNAKENGVSSKSDYCYETVMKTNSDSFTVKISDNISIKLEIQSADGENGKILQFWFKDIDYFIDLDGIKKLMLKYFKQGNRDNNFAVAAYYARYYLNMLTPEQDEEILQLICEFGGIDSEWTIQEYRVKYRLYVSMTYGDIDEMGISSETVSKYKADIKPVINIFVGMDILRAVAESASVSSKQNETQDEVKSEQVKSPEQKPITEKRIITIEEFLENRSEYRNYKGELKVTGKAPQNCGELFVHCCITALDLSDLDTSDVTNMFGMFAACCQLEEINLSNFNTSNVTNMCNMFSCCHKLKSIDLSSFDTAKVQYMLSMFSYCYELTMIDISHFNIYQVVTMERMFEKCTNLKHVELPKFDVPSEPLKLRNMLCMFAHCENLEYVDMSNWTALLLVETRAVFYNCYNLEHVKLPDFITGKVNNSVYLSHICDSELEYTSELYNTNIARTTNMMFYNCPAGEKYRDNPKFAKAFETASDDND